MVFDCIIIGAGAAGVVCAIEAGSRKKKILLLEHKDRILKKVLVTGNGRCNFTNLNADYTKYTGINEKLIKNLLNNYGSSKVINFFENLGICPYTENKGKTYPRSLQASSIVDSLRLKLDELKIETKFEYVIDKIEKNEELFCVNNKYYSKKLVLATGGYSYQNLGSDGSGYNLAKKFGHSLTELTPILVQLKTEKEYVKGLEGIKVDAVVSAEYMNECIRKEKGELLFTPYGISGPTIFNLSYLLPKYMFNLVYSVDFVPEMEEFELIQYLYKSCLLYTSPSPRD